VVARTTGVDGKGVWEPQETHASSLNGGEEAPVAVQAISEVKLGPCRTVRQKCVSMPLLVESIGSGVEIGGLLFAPNEPHSLLKMNGRDCCGGMVAVPLGRKARCGVIARLYHAWRPGLSVAPRSNQREEDPATVPCVYRPCNSRQ
jgi:hypothetical protein